MAIGDTPQFGVFTLPDTNANKLAAANGGPSTGGRVIHLKNISTNDILLGHDNTVSTSNGYPLGADEEITLEILTPSKVWIKGTAADKLAWAMIKG